MEHERQLKSLTAFWKRCEQSLDVHFHRVDQGTDMVAMRWTCLSAHSPTTICSETNCGPIEVWTTRARHLRRARCAHGSRCGQLRERIQDPSYTCPARCNCHTVKQTWDLHTVIGSKYRLVISPSFTCLQFVLVKLRAKVWMGRSRKAHVYASCFHSAKSYFGIREDWAAQRNPRSLLMYIRVLE